MKSKRWGLVAGAGVATAAGAGVGWLFRPLPATPLPGTVLRLDGEDIHFVEAGAGPALVLIHGFAESTFNWREVMPELATTHRVVAIDLPGFGFSDRNPRLAYSLDAHARRVHRLMVQLGIERATVIGHSMGGAVAQRFALAFTDAVEAVVLASSLDASAEAPWLDNRRLRPAVRRFLYIGLRSSALVRYGTRRTVLDIVADPSYATAEIIDGYARPILVPGTARALARLAEGVASEPPADLTVLDVPTLVVSGELDRSVPVAIGQGLARKIRGARHVVLPGVGHLTAEERPDLFLAEVRAFLATIGSAAVAAAPL